MESPNFWEDKSYATKISRESSSLIRVLDLLEEIEKELSDNSELIEISKEDMTYLEKLSSSLGVIEKKILELEEESLYFSEYDNHEALLSVNAGAGGVDAHDWAEMLYRMYTRFLEKSNIYLC